jgi:hypothetical protein
MHHAENLDYVTTAGKFGARRAELTGCTTATGARKGSHREEQRYVLNRRDFHELCVALGSFLAASCALDLHATGEASPGAGRTVKFRDGTVVPALGQGSWHLGQGSHPAAEEEALRTGLSLGMTLIDTSVNYGDDQSEKLIGRAIVAQRDRVFRVCKVETDQVTGDGMARASQTSCAWRKKPGLRG